MERAWGEVALKRPSSVEMRDCIVTVMVSIEDSSSSHTYKEEGQKSIDVAPCVCDSDEEEEVEEEPSFIKHARDAKTLAFVRSKGVIGVHDKVEAKLQVPIVIPHVHSDDEEEEGPSFIKQQLDAKTRAFIQRSKISMISKRMQSAQHTLICQRSEEAPAR